jgi:hypothetical protein
MAYKDPRVFQFQIFHHFNFVHKIQLSISRIYSSPNSIVEFSDVRAIAQAPASHRGGAGLIPSQVMWDLLWKMWHWRVFSHISSVSPASSYSINC